MIIGILFEHPKSDSLFKGKAKAENSINGSTFFVAVTLECLE